MVWKTWTGENHANSELRIVDSASLIPNMDIVASDPRVAMWGIRDQAQSVTDGECGTEPPVPLGVLHMDGHPPKMLCVVCGMTTFAYRRPDWVYVVPLTSLGP